MDTIYGIMEAIYDVCIPLAVVAALFGMRWKEQFWGNILAVFSVFFSILVAVNWFEPIAQLVNAQSVGMLFLADYLFLWLLFIVSLVFFMELTRGLSRVNVQFPIPIENAGNFLAIMMLVCLVWGFFGFSLNLAPLGETAGVTVAEKDPMIISTLRQLSAGNLSNFGGKKPFDEFGEFRKDHLLRKQALLQYRLKSDEYPFFYEGELPPVKGVEPTPDAGDEEAQPKANINDNPEGEPANP
ncbi:MAG: hypothetical protein LBQ66_08240 [Planctomycetaceae bacterium]|jgi:hypothetical protein|nr:hypothetical protein [Planctomycetaceae bacterium]